MDRVALIVVHGVADQKRGETASAVAQQIASMADGEVQQSDCTVTVVPVYPAKTYAGWPRSDLVGRLWKSLTQSTRSDFLDAARGGRAADATTHSEKAWDPGTSFTDYLFAKARNGTSDPGPPSRPYAHQAVCLAVRSGQRAIDVFEMYWADLSRLSGAAPRILSELFTLLFNLSRLGASTVALAAVVEPTNRGLGWLSRVQRTADWLFSRILAMIFLQLLFCAAIVAAAAWVTPHVRVAAIVLAITVAIAFIVYLVLRPEQRHSSVALGVVAVVEVLLGSAAILDAPVGLYFLLVVWVTLLCGIQERLLDYWERRFRGVYGCGLLAAAITLGIGTSGVIAHGDSTSAEAWVAGGLRAVEALLLAAVVFWGFMAILLAAVVVCGTWAIRAGDAIDARERHRKTVATGRLGLFASIGVFLAFGMTLWALIDGSLRSLAAGFHYSSFWLDRAPSAIDASAFLESRFNNSTALFAVIAIQLGLLVGLLLIVLLPCVVLEVRLVRSDALKRVQAWLTDGFKVFDGAIAWWVWLSAGLVLIGAASLLGAQWIRIFETHMFPDWARFEQKIQGWSHDWLSVIVYSLVGATTGLIAIGGIALKKLQALRVPLDAALDVDNHFREFPRRAIPRVVIFERYIALLDMVLRIGYDRIVIVAHSQGTVITAELLRYLRQRSRSTRDKEGRVDPLAELGGALADADVSLLTVGCPLRQLYARRFPDLYQWVVADLGNGRFGPDYAELGIKHWLNRWGAADYVGRWLWEKGSGPDNGDDNIGADAHTHYFETAQTKVVVALQSLIWAA